jgi:uncharacterized protein involved in exopolysaccharide biosynthesis
MAVVWFLPNSYKSEAILGFSPQQVSRRYVAEDASGSAEIVTTFTRQILSRPSLVRIVNEFDLYADDRDESTPPELLAERMLSDVKVEPLDIIGPDLTSFKITFTAGDPRLAQQVTSRVVSLFMDQQKKTRGNKIESTTSFLATQADDARKKVAEQEARLQAFKSRYSGELPEQQDLNMVALNNARDDRKTVSDSLKRARSDRQGVLATASERVTRLQAELATLREKYTEYHPTVTQKTQEIVQMQAFVEGLREGRTSGLLSGPLSTDAGLSQLVHRIDLIDRDIQDLTRQDEQLRQRMEDYEARIRVAPLREQQLQDISRDYTLLKDDYAELKKNQLQSQLTAGVEERQEGQQFQVLEPPSLPVRASGPNRLKLSLGGFAVAIGLGIVLAFAREKSDPSFHKEAALAESFKVPIVIGVPLLLSPREKQRRRVRRTLEMAGGVALVAVLATAEFLMYRYR